MIKIGKLTIYWCGKFWRFYVGEWGVFSRHKLIHLGPFDIEWRLDDKWD